MLCKSDSNNCLPEKSAVTVVYLWTYWKVINDKYNDLLDVSPLFHMCIILNMNPAYYIYFCTQVFNFILSSYAAYFKLSVFV